MTTRTSSFPSLLHLAGVTAMIAVVFGVALWREMAPATWGTAMQWALAAASLTFTVVHTFSTKQFNRTTLGLLVLAPCSLISHYFVVAAGVLLVIQMFGWFIDEFL